MVLTIILTFKISWKLFFINDTNPKDPKNRKRYWRHILRARAPDGLKIEDEWFLNNFFLDTIFVYRILQFVLRVLEIDPLDNDIMCYLSKQLQNITFIIFLNLFCAFVSDIEFIILLFLCLFVCLFVCIVLVFVYYLEGDLETSTCYWWGSLWQQLTTFGRFLLSQGAGF